ncbi:MAG: hypothetical protein JWQ01_4465, partial [Massilia sp.]|nr:hypothetical protein [Massilia sp.]
MRITRMLALALAGSMVAASALA